MNYQTIDLLDKLISKDTDKDLKLLFNEGVLSTEGQIDLNKFKLMTEAFAADLLDSITEAEVNVHEVLSYMEDLQRKTRI